MCGCLSCRRLFAPEKVRCAQFVQFVERLADLVQDFIPLPLRRDCVQLGIGRAHFFLELRYGLTDFLDPRVEILLLLRNDDAHAINR